MNNRYIGNVQNENIESPKCWLYQNSIYCKNGETCSFVQLTCSCYLVLLYNCSTHLNWFTSQIVFCFCCNIFLILPMDCTEVCTAKRFIGVQQICWTVSAVTSAVVGLSKPLNHYIQKEKKILFSCLQYSTAAF